MSATFVEAGPLDFDWNHWLRSELAPTHARKIRTAIMVAGAVLCVVISMALQVPQLATSAYMVFFISKENKLLTTITCSRRVYQSRARPFRPQNHFCGDVLLHRL